MHHHHAYTILVIFQRFYNELRALLNSFQNDKPLLLVLDDINLLLNCGVDKTTLANFMHYCFTLTQTMDKVEKISQDFPLQPNSKLMNVYWTNA